jgi:glutamate dehydrogenase
MMLSRLDKAKIDAKQDLLARAVAVGARHPDTDGPGGLDRAAIDALLGRYYRHVPPEDMLDRDPQDLYGAAVAHYSLAAARPPGRAAVRVYTPTVEGEGWSSGHTVIEVVTEDMPFLVDSVANELNRQGRAIHTVVHPQFAVRRSLTGELDQVCADTDPNEQPRDTLVESWIHLEIDREGDPDALARVQRDLTRVLGDVRDVVEDWQKMRAVALRIAGSLPSEPVPDAVAPAEVTEASELLRWLADEHFTFIGYREYQLITDDDGRERLRAVPGTGLGISRPDKLVSVSFAQNTEQGRARFRERRLLTLTKSSERSTVHRPAYLDYIGVRTFDGAGNVTGERRFLGLLSSAAYAESVTRSPVLKRKVAEVFAEAGLDTSSHDGRDLLEILETYPRDELFQIAVRDLAPIALSVLYLQERRKLRLYLRRDDYGRYLSALVYLPRDRFNTQVRLTMQNILLRELGGESIDYTLRSTESTLARLHFVIRTPVGADLPEHLDDEHLQDLLAEATRQWEDDFADALIDQCGEERAGVLRERYLAAVPEAYRADFPARIAVADLRRIDALPATGGLAMNLYQPLGPATPGMRRFKLYRLGEAMSLSTLLPVLARLGVEVTDERPYAFPLANGGTAWVYDLGLRYDPALEPRLATCRQQFQDAFAAVLAGDAENDGFNQLVLGAGLTWRQAMVLRAYAKYLRQAGGAFSQEYTVQTLRTNPEIVRLLVALFETRLDPAGGPPGDLAREATSSDLITRLTVELDAVESLDADRILRSLLRLIRGTLRTNYFQTDGNGQPKRYLSVKLDPQAIPELPQPRPVYEIWVYSPRVEGVHLRFGRVARGGLRWSDRREDFRTEVLGLVKAQMVKNAVIVPVGAKGGFVCKRLPDASDREAWLAEGKACYSTFIRALLDVTDNRVVRDGDRHVQPPPQVHRRDGDDPYLVVAADKGTATFSDLANSIAAEYGFWLGDAFASGGSAGYDHKAMGITARGAWESVKRHFRELSVDCQSQDVTVVGIGDMSGDVFGNGMLLSRHIRLVAAFDHRHIFLDPDPDAATSYAERARIFALPRSSWADYDVAVISPGGGIYPRSAKAIPITHEVRARLGLPDGLVSLPPAELMRAILSAPVDLLWNGGIGTYVKASAETNAEVGDKSNDAIRVDGGELRARVVGEGGNLGLTQLGRIEYALAGGRVNTDAIDNSAGVDTSDHEVNIKILLDSVAAAGDLTHKQRNELLETMTAEVAELVLRDNYDQNVALATALVQAPSMLDVHGRLIRWMERDGRLNRALEFLPSDKGIADRRHAGTGLTQPELAVLLAYTKIIMTDELLASDIPEDPSLRRVLHRYFPTPLRERYAARIERHPLQREIVVTCVVNDMINNAGITSLWRLREESGAEPAELARAHAVATEVYDADRVWAQVEALDNKVPTGVQNRMRLESRKLTERVTRWFLSNRRPPLDIEKQVAQFRDGVAEVVAQLPALLRGVDAQRLEQTRAELTAAGVPDELAVSVAALPAAFAALDICEVAQDTGRSVVEVAEVYFDLADRVQLATLLDRVLALPRTDRWNSLARAALRDDLYRAHAGLARHVLACGEPDSVPEQRFADWVRRNQAILDRTGQTLADIAASDTWDLATLSVALRVINSLLRHSGL